MSESDKSLLAKLRGDFTIFYGDRLAGLILFGSQARGDSDGDSDYDILVLLHGNVLPIQELNAVSGLLSDASLESNKVIACCFVSEDEYANSQKELHRSIKAEGVPF